MAQPGVLRLCDECTAAGPRWRARLAAFAAVSQWVSDGFSSLVVVDRRRFKALSETTTTAQQPQQQQQFLRLPVESARKLRFYERPDLSELVAQHARDRAQLEAANASLRKVGCGRCQCRQLLLSH
jgi:hypothetical protein